MKSSKAPWDEVFMNFIIKLSKSKNSTNEKAYDTILVMIDRLIKYCHIIFFKKIYNVEQLRHVVLNRLIRYQGISRKFINDKDKLFTLNYWRTLLSMLGAKLKMSITFHPQTNEQTKKTNQSLKQYLRHYINNIQSNWVKLLFMAQLTLNAKVSNTTKTTSFFANFGRESNLFEKPRNQVLVEVAIVKGDKIKAIQNNISKMQKSSTTYQNKRRKTAPLLKKRNKVYLLTKNFKINKKRSKKLNHVKVESFFIKSAKRRVNYELNLPSDVKIFFVFHISILKFAHSNTPIQITFQYKSQEDQKYEVERILRQKGQQYFVKWKKYFTSKNTWKSKENLTNCSKELKRFREANQERWGTSRSKYLGEPLVPTRYRWWALAARKHALLGLTLQCFAAPHPPSFAARFRRTLRADGNGWCRGEPGRKCSQDGRIPDTCPNHRQSCMLFPGENSGNKDASRGHRYQVLPTNYTYVGTTFSFVWAWPMIRKEG